MDVHRPQFASNFELLLPENLQAVVDIPAPIREKYGLVLEQGNCFTGQLPLKFYVRSTRGRPNGISFRPGEPLIVVRLFTKLTMDIVWNSRVSSASDASDATIMRYSDCEPPNGDARVASGVMQGIVLSSGASEGSPKAYEAGTDVAAGADREAAVVDMGAAGVDSDESDLIAHSPSEYHGVLLKIKMK